MTLLFFYLCILLTGLALYTSFGKTAEKRGLYTKFFSFALVTVVVYQLLHRFPDHAFVLYLLISLGALYELSKACPNPGNGFSTASILLLTVFSLTGFARGFPHSALFLCVLSFDAFSQFAGQLLGRHALCRNISPNKTLEGCAGGLTVCMLTSCLVFGSAWKGIYIACFALCGDLLASYVKRRAGIKDFGRLLPGQGGLLDRFDSYILSAIFYLPIL